MMYASTISSTAIHIQLKYWPRGRLDWTSAPPGAEQQPVGIFNRKKLQQYKYVCMEFRLCCCCSCTCISLLLYLVVVVASLYFVVVVAVVVVSRSSSMHSFSSSLASSPPALSQSLYENCSPFCTNCSIDLRASGLLTTWYGLSQCRQP